MADVVAHLLEQIELLTPEQLELLRNYKERLTVQHRRFAAEYIATGSKKEAARAAGISAGRALHNPGVVRMVQEGMQKMEEKCELKGEYVRQYILDVLELCPTDYFIVSETGEWMIDPENFRLLPREVKRLVEGVEVKRVGREMLWKVNFVSKQSALAMAARFTLVQKIDHRVAQVPWEELAAQAERDVADPIAERLKQYELLTDDGPDRAEEVPMAERPPVRQAGGDSEERVA